MSEEIIFPAFKDISEIRLRVVPKICRRMNRLPFSAVRRIVSAVIALEVAATSPTSINSSETSSAVSGVLTERTVIPDVVSLYPSYSVNSIEPAAVIASFRVLTAISRPMIPPWALSASSSATKSTASSSKTSLIVPPEVRVTSPWELTKVSMGRSSTLRA